jgi:AcrR family transcriptional regulator
LAICQHCGVATKRVRLEHDERRRQILGAARRLFCVRPYSDISMQELADAAGVARGLLHHYFGSKRDLYLAVVRELARVPTLPVEQAWEASVDAWLDLMSANRDAWLTAIGAGGAGRDAELEAILDAAKELVAERALEAQGVDRASMTPQRRAVARVYGGLAEEVTREWLDRGRLDRGQARSILVAALPALLRIPSLEGSH